MKGSSMADETAENAQATGEAAVQEAQGATGTTASATPEAAAPEEAALKPVYALVATKNTVSVAQVARVKATEYVDAIHENLRRQFLAPAGAMKFKQATIGSIDVIVHSFATVPGYAEYDVIAALVDAATEA